MFTLLRPEDTIRLVSLPLLPHLPSAELGSTDPTTSLTPIPPLSLQAVRLESAYPQCTRYMVVVSTNGRQDTEESLVLGMDFSSSDRSVSPPLTPPLATGAITVQIDLPLKHEALGVTLLSCLCLFL